MVRNYKPKAKKYNDETLKSALKDIVDGAKIRETGRKYFIPYGTLRDQYNAWSKVSDNTEPHPQAIGGKKEGRPH